MYEIDLSTIMLIGIDAESTKVVTMDSEFIINNNSKFYTRTNTSRNFI